jgi:hypothetical protein
LYAEDKFADARAAFNKMFLLLDSFQDHRTMTAIQNENLQSTTTQQAAGNQNIAFQNYEGVTPECLNRGSSSGLTWIPDKGIRE